MDLHFHVCKLLIKNVQSRSWVSMEFWLMWFVVTVVWLAWFWHSQHSLRVGSCLHFEESFEHPLQTVSVRSVRLNVPLHRSNETTKSLTPPVGLSNLHFIFVFSKQSYASYVAAAAGELTKPELDSFEQQVTEKEHLTYQVKWKLLTLSHWQRCLCIALQRYLLKLAC